MVVWTLQGTSGIEISKALNHFSFMNEAKVEEIETRLSKFLDGYIDVRKLYEDELRKIHVYKERIEELEAKVQALEAEVASLREKLANVEQVVTVEKIQEQENQEQSIKDTTEAPTQTYEVDVGDIKEPSNMSVDAPPTQ